MAINPYQGNVPDLRDNGQTGRSIIRPSVDTHVYDEMLRRSSAERQANAKSSQDLLDLMRNRTIKAESDDLESRYMDLVNSRMFDPAQGYMATAGKNAMDQYAQVGQDLKKGMDDLLEGADGQVRLAVEGRLKDRYQAAQGQAMQHNLRETTSYHIKSSEARVNALLESLAKNPNDDDFVARTRSSISQELDYLCGLTGTQGDIREKMLGEYWDLTEKMVLKGLSDKSPMEAYEYFKSGRCAINSEKSRNAIDQQLFEASKTQLALLVARLHGGSLTSKPDFLRSMMRPGFKTGIDLVDGLTHQQKTTVFTAAYQFAAQERARREADLKQQMAAERAAAEAGKDAAWASNMVTYDNLVAVYGPEQAETEWKDFCNQKESAYVKYLFMGMNAEDRDTAMKALEAEAATAASSDERKLAYSTWSAANEARKLSAKQERNTLQFSEAQVREVIPDQEEASKVWEGVLKGNPTAIERVRAAYEALQERKGTKAREARNRPEAGTPLDVARTLEARRAGAMDAQDAWKKDPWGTVRTLASQGRSGWPAEIYTEIDWQNFSNMKDAMYQRLHGGVSWSESYGAPRRMLTNRDRQIYVQGWHGSDGAGDSASLKMQWIRRTLGGLEGEDLTRATEIMSKEVSFVDKEAGLAIKLYGRSHQLAAKFTSGLDQKGKVALVPNSQGVLGTIGQLVAALQPAGSDWNEEKFAMGGGGNLLGKSLSEDEYKTAAVALYTYYETKAKAEAVKEGKTDWQKRMPTAPDIAAEVIGGEDATVGWAGGKPVVVYKDMPLKLDQMMNVAIKNRGLFGGESQLIDTNKYGQLVWDYSLESLRRDLIDGGISFELRRFNGKKATYALVRNGRVLHIQGRDERAARELTATIDRETGEVRSRWDKNL